MTTDQTETAADFDGCNRDCRKAGKHTMRWGGCEHATPPEPTVSMSRVYTAADGHPAIGYDTYTVPELARLIETAAGDPVRAAAVARTIVQRNDPATTVSPPAAPADTPDDGERRARYAAAMDAVTGGICPTDLIDAVMNVADRELAARRAADLRDAEEICDEAGATYTGRALNEHADAAYELMARFRRKAEEAEHTPAARPAVADREQAELRTRAEAMERAMESTAADALKHRGCHRDLMAQCLRAEGAEARVAELERQQADTRATVLRELADKAEEWDGHITMQELRRMARKAAPATLLRRLADETPAGEAHPAEHTWAAELHDPLADEWVPGTRYLARDRAVNHLIHARLVGPTWKDGTPTRRRLVRATTTYTVEAEHTPEQQP